ncbi:hypothetical protein SAMN04490190_1671 [Pseudomonas libanensis]|uniref:Uncharacterized protein n=1 Tax=Pseudomonas libanensis TaxID=75588 RepID=A0A0R2YBP5_9PSED|nr:hypothetical protein [Pseudomonas libanensis]KRP45887.1 hypothetical protein TU73_12220 [Pseudomonas libanensis]KRP45893.1 hypothetical protein TU73_12250 [Pseudomonas libanensis]SDK79400.1 hypothetical protein SAMN04490190_1668 [Pseudomonas libanensis]SDK79450.1 hypothetical protein SAMN04490190_1671 [Pseudomonas libanensis]
MNKSQALLYTNDVSLEFLSELNKSSFTEQKRSEFTKQVLDVIDEQNAYRKAHPPIAIYRVAAEGSQTRNGGVIKKTTSQMAFKLADGSQVRAAHKGDCVVYADGTTAQIVTCAGEANSHIALVGSTLSNGDEIINTPQGSVLLIAREGVQKADDFL